MSDEGSVTTSASTTTRSIPKSLSFQCNANNAITKEQQRLKVNDSCCVIRKVETVSTSTTVDSNHRRSSRLKMMKKLALPKNSINEGIVENFIECFNNHDVDGCIALTSPQCEWRFSGEVSIVIKDMGDMIQKIVDSFPDFCFDFDAAVEVGPGVVQVNDAVASGSHIGQPFGFHNYKPLAANGVKCVNDLEHINFYMFNGRIAQVHVTCTGQFCGPVGLYKQVKLGQFARRRKRAGVSARQIKGVVAIAA